MNTPGIGERIKEVRGKTSLFNFAAMHSIHKSTLIRYEKEETSPDASFLADLCRKYMLNAGWLLLGQGSKEKILDDRDRWVSFHYVHSMILDTFEHNKRSGRRIVLATFLAYFSEQQKNSLIDVSLSAALSLERMHHVINCEDKTLIEIAEDLTKNNYRTKHDAFCAMSDILIENDNVYIFCDLSKSKDTNNKEFYKMIIRAIEKGHLDKKTPKSDIIFLDSPSFLEKHWASLGVYFKTNILNGSSFFI